MRREAKLNLIFLLVILAASLPGVIMLLRKRATEDVRPMLPPPVRNSFAYMDPNPGNFELVRINPPLTSDFVCSLANNLLKFGPDDLKTLVPRPDFRAVMSVKRDYQIVATSKDGSMNKVIFLGWNRRLKSIAERYTFQARTTADQIVPGRVTGCASEKLGLDMISELKNYGFIVPPSTVIWYVVEFPATAPIASINITCVDQMTLTDHFEFASQVPTTMPN